MALFGGLVLFMGVFCLKICYNVSIVAYLDVFFKALFQMINPD
ncbi:hypothetical protein MNBD_ALPHA02-974 [hydrothermal vent metagenome]|uniref:Uncharacterized protein n=1 Tax=hydrothermal vent metagenome TaxID=652676 RepID=A0A3B0RRV3_9ZZZZ